MNFVKTNEYDNFLAQLRQISFCTVQRTLYYRRDLVAFRSKDGKLKTKDYPQFGSEYANLTEAEQARAEEVYSHYCGFSDDVSYMKNTRSNRLTCFMPALSGTASRQTPPKEGEIIFGHVEDSPRGGKRFIWWNFAMKQDRNFANLLLGNESFSKDKLPKKLVIESHACSNWKLFLLAKALHFQDMDYFLNQIERFGEQPLELNLACSLDEWLQQHVAPLLPEFYKEFRRNTSLARP